MAIFGRTHRRPRRYLAEVVTQDGRLLRRERFSTDTAAEAVRVWQELIAPRLTSPLADRVEFYATADEPNAPPISIIQIRKRAAALPARE